MATVRSGVESKNARKRTVREAGGFLNYILAEVFMKGKNIYFTHKEIIALYLTIEDFEENASETVYSQRLQNGLGTAWHKIKDCVESRELEKKLN